MPLRYTTDHAASSYGIPVIVDGEGNAYGPDDLVTVTQAARLLGRDRSRIRDYIEDGRLPAGWFGNQRSIRVGDLAALKVQPEGWPKGRARK